MGDAEILAILDAGVVAHVGAVGEHGPVRRVYGAPIPAPDLTGSVPVPPAIAQLAQD